MEGPFDKVITFVRVGDPGEDVPIPHAPGLAATNWPISPATRWASCCGRNAGDRGARRAGPDEHDASRRWTRLDAEPLGELLMFFQLATGYAGVWYGIDPFDQPGVELGKRLTFAAMGRPGYSK